ncbi:DUF4123 domain-containing protein [Xenophilus aerolatus]
MSNYFAVDPMSPGTVAAFLGVWRSLSQAHAGLRLYAMVDAAFDEQQFARHLDRHEGAAVSLYAGTELAELDSIAPWLLELNAAGSPALTQQIRQLAELRGTRPMLSFFATRCDLGSLQRHFQSFLFTAIDGDLRWMLRLADTRILESLSRVLSPLQIDALFPGDIHVWFPLRRDGQAAVRSIDPTRSDSKGGGPMAFDAKQFEAMVEAGEADLVVTHLTLSNPRCFDGARPAEIHGFIDEQVRRAHAHGIEDARSLETYCVAALALGARFDEQPEFAFAITQAVPVPGSLVERFADIPDQTWRQVKASLGSGDS